MSPFALGVAGRLDSIRGKHKPINSAHEGESVIREEFEEFWDEVKKQTEHRSKLRMLNELIDIAAACQRTAEDLGLINKESA